MRFHVLLNRSITRRTILRIAPAIAATPFGVTAQTSSASTPNESDFGRRIFSRINQLREQNGAEPLQWSDSLADCARQQSIRKVELRFPGHEDPERGGVAERLRTAGIGWTRCGENIFMEKGWDDPVNFAVVFWWYSPGHQANLLNPEYTDTGVGLAQGPDRAWFITQIFLEQPSRAHLRHFY
jgi:uncharacterized protein YkwD